MSETFNVIDIADYIIIASRNVISSTKLDAILYPIYKDYYKLYKEPLFTEPFYKTNFTLINKEVHYRYFMYGAGKIVYIPVKEWDLSLTDHIKAFLRHEWNKYKGFSVFDLVDFNNNGLAYKKTPIGCIASSFLIMDDINSERDEETL